MPKHKTTTEETITELPSMVRHEQSKSGWSLTGLTIPLSTGEFLLAGMKSALLYYQRGRGSQRDLIDQSAGAAAALGVPLDGNATVQITY